MRNFAKAALSVAVLAVATSVCFAQRGGGRGMQMTPEGPLLLGNKSVQDELKLTDDQKKDVKTVTDAQREKMTKAFQDNKGDMEAIQKAMKDINDESNKALTKTMDSLTDAQKKRFKEIEVQVKGLKAFSDEKVVAELKLTDKQKDDFKVKVDDFEKDRRALMTDAGRDQTKRTEAQTKITENQAKLTDTIVGSLTDDQKKTWKDLTGEKFTYKPDQGGGRGAPKNDKSF